MTSKPNKYAPHQGKKEMNRRLKQMGKEPIHGVITYTYGIPPKELNVKVENDEQLNIE